MSFNRSDHSGNVTGAHTAESVCHGTVRSHRIVRREGENGREIVIIGNANHPEVEGIRGWCVSKVTVIGTEEEAEEFEPNSDTGVGLFLDGHPSQLSLVQPLLLHCFSAIFKPPHTNLSLS